MSHIKDKIPDILYQSIDESLAYGAWVNEDDDDICVKIDSYLVLNRKFETLFGERIDRQCEKVFRHDANKDEIFDELSKTYDTLKRQLEWSFKIKDSARALYYTKIVYFLIVTLARNEKKYLLEEGKELSDGKWNKQKISLGVNICSFFNRAIKEAKWDSLDIRQEATACISAIEIDLISLPSLIEITNKDTDAEEPVQTLVHAIEILKRLPETNIISYPTSYWLAKAYRHLAMANIKESRHQNALIFLHISSIYLRYLDGDVYEELAEERLRGFAEIYKTLGNNSVANKYLEGTKYSNETIAGYFREPEEMELDQVGLNVCLVRHGERDSDENRKFGFTDLTTSKGNKQQAAVLGSLKREIKGRYSNVVIVSSEQLEKDAHYFRQELKSAFDSDGCTFEVITKTEWNPINVGSFRGLDEKKASIEYPGEYSTLTDYRNGSCCGYNLSFPKGETVIGFERRISSAFSEILSYAISKSKKETLSSFLKETVIVVLGHTSSVTACLNIISDFDGFKLDSPYYKFYPIETGSIITGNIDLRNHEVNLESRQPMVL